MLESIKNLKPEDKFKAFIIVVLLSTISSITTVYLSTDDCTGLSNQYKSLVDNYTHTLDINNRLIRENNEKKDDLIYVSHLVDSLMGLKTKTRKTTSINREPVIVRSAVSPNDSLLHSSPRIVTPEVITVENTVIKNELNSKQEELLHKIKNLTDKYEN
jgi:hypothetical protein